MSKTTIIHCPKCETAHNATEEMIGAKVRCSSCNEKFILENIAKELHDDDRFILLDKIGQGGMGAVFRAEQTALQRNIALKVLDEKLVEDEDDKAAFFQEAIITANLNHPNIVPIHEFGTMDNGTVYYTMKEIVGESWEQTILLNSINRNLEILLKICDAVAFAHDKRFIHRDIKPENVMLGEYGEILLVDWGLAVSVDKEKYPNIRHVSDLVNTSGSPAFMAPEMALSQTDKIGIQSDIYLLGAILFFFITKTPPHPHPDPLEALEEAKKNILAETDMDNEFIEIAKVAMSTNPEDRFSSVMEFQKKIKSAIEHIESIKLVGFANDDLKKAVRTKDYQKFNQVIYACNEALKINPDNSDAEKVLDLGVREYSACAMDKADFDLVLSITNGDEKYQDIIKMAKKGISLRDSRIQKIKLMKLFSFIILIVVVAILAISVIQISKSKDEALKAKNEAIKSKRNADKSAALAKKAKDDAIAEQIIANVAKNKAEKERIKAEIAESKAKESMKQARIAEKKAYLSAWEAEEERKNAQKALDKMKKAQNSLQLSKEKNKELATLNQEAEKLDKNRQKALLNDIINNILNKEYNKALKQLELSPEKYKWKNLYKILHEVINCKDMILENAKNEIGKQRNLNNKIIFVQKVDDNYIYIGIRSSGNIITKKYKPNEQKTFLNVYYPEINPISLEIYLGNAIKRYKTVYELKEYLQTYLSELKDI